MPRSGNSRSLPAKQAEFEAHYGPDGSWARLFRRANGYLGSELLRTARNPLRYLTIDRWASREAWQAFRREYAAEYERLDREFEGLTTREAPLGEYAPAGGDASVTVQLPGRGRLRLPRRPLPHGNGAALRALLPLPLVPARVRRLFRPERHDRGRPRDAASPASPSSLTRRPRAARARRSRAARAAASRSGATTRVRAGRSRSSASARSTTPMPCRRTSTSSRRRSSPGSCCPRARRPCPEYYDRKQHWPAESLARREALLARRLP